MNTPDPAEEAAAQGAQAVQDLADIAALRRFEPFQRYFMREPEERVNACFDKLLDRKLTELDRQFVLGQIDVYKRWFTKLDQDEGNNRSLAGLAPLPRKEGQ